MYGIKFENIKCELPVNIKMELFSQLEMKKQSLERSFGFYLTWLKLFRSAHNKVRMSNTGILETILEFNHTGFPFHFLKNLKILAFHQRPSTLLNVRQSEH